MSRLLDKAIGWTIMMLGLTVFMIAVVVIYVSVAPHPNPMEVWR